MYASYHNYNQGEEKQQPQQDVPRISYDITNPTFFNSALPDYEMIVVKAWAPWCMPCNTTAPMYEALGHRLKDYVQQDRLLLLKDNIDNEDSIHKEHVSVVPTYFVYIHGKIEKVYTGVDFEEFESLVTSHFARKMSEATTTLSNSIRYTDSND
jgi:thiol-disulfide isomerase/thioredoxin